MHPRFNFFRNDVMVEDKNIVTKRNEIINNLNALKLNEKNIQKIINTIENMPSSSHVMRAVAFLTELTDKKSRCEHHYLHSDYIAELFCTLSNVGFFAVAYCYNDYAALLAGIFSTISHAVPLKRLNELDKMAAILAFLSVLSHVDVLVNNPGVVAAGAATLLFGVMDYFVGRKNMDIFGPAFHVAWHFAAAFALSQFNHAVLAEHQIQETAPTFTI